MDLIAGVAMEAGEAAIGAKMARAKMTKAKLSKTSKGGKKYNRLPACTPCRRRRSADEDILSDGYHHSSLSNELIPMLPESMGNVTLTNGVTPTNIVDGILAIVLALQLMKIRHARSEPYYTEICTRYLRMVYLCKNRENDFAIFSLYFLYKPIPTYCEGRV